MEVLILHIRKKVEGDTNMDTKENRKNPRIEYFGMKNVVFGV